MITLVHSWKKFLTLGLEEDSFSFDWTARALMAGNSSRPEKTITAKLIAKSNGIWAADAGLKALELLSAEMGMPIQIKSFVQDGASLEPKKTICEWTGASSSVLVFERTFINLAAYCGGIATQTNSLVKKANSAGLKNPPRITGTRKTLPAYRDLAIQSTLIGGAHPHRYNLSGGLLLKENHIAAAGSIAKAIKNARSIAPHLLKIEIEVKDLTELKEAISAGAEVIMLDNFKPEQVKEAILLKPNSVTFEVSGGINSTNIDQYLIEGLDVISVGSITHSVTSIDLSLLVDLL
jgi:nicotinate-nucleotide pyrophosphorylase (carboxylating)